MIFARTRSTTVDALARVALAALLFGACTANDGIVAPSPGLELPTGSVVISQVYGGGGNSGATIKNDFIELYNNTPNSVNLTGWSVQYSSSAGTTWQVTALPSVSLPSGRYYLIQEAAGTAGVTSLPTPDVIGVIPMSATAGKVALVNSVTALAEGCPVGGNPSVVDFVGYGGANCSESTPTSALSNSTAAIRKNAGTTDTDNNALDFTSDATPIPRNVGSSGVTPTGTGKVVTIGAVALVVVNPSPGAVTVGATMAFNAIPRDAMGLRTPTTFTWGVSNASIASINAITGVVTGVATGSTKVAARASNGVVSDSVIVTVSPALASLSVSPRADPLPVGFQTQLFASGTDASAATINSNTQVNWTTNNAGIATVNASGIVTGVGAGTARITTTAKSDGTTKGFTDVVVTVASTAPSARVGHNTDLGVPTDADPSDDVLVARRQYTLSYNPRRGGPNWVSWNLDASHKGSVSRCNCFTADPALTALGVFAFDTNDWINGGAYSRGHMSPSADWAISDGENAPTFYLSNMLPQNQTLNGGVWGSLENDLRSLAVNGVEIYIVSGPIYTKNRSGIGIDGLGFLASTTQPNKIAIPDSIWKIAIVVPNADDVATIASPSSVQVIAANFPNTATGTSSAAVNSWAAFTTTIDAIQRSTGYNFLSLIPEAVQCRLEVRTCP